MSQANVEIVRRLFDAVASRDAATVLALYDADVVWDTSRSPFGDLMGGTLYYGHEGVRTWSHQWYEAWEHVEHDCEELIDAGERVISVVTNRGRGRASGVEVELHQSAVWTIRDGRIVRSVWFPSRKEALEAVGLRE
jgi:ketosteroid isomerase-like protein